MIKNLLLSFFLLVLLAGELFAQKVFLNPSDQYGNLVAGGGNEAEYALINAQLTKKILEAKGFAVKLDQNFYNAPHNANSWGADIFISIHSNASGGHGTETLYISSGGKILASHIQNGLLSKLPYSDRGLKFRNDLYVLKTTKMFACLTEVVFHDCAVTSGYKGHPPSESSFLKSTDGQQKISSGIAAGVCSYYGKNCGYDIEPPNKGWLKGVVYKYPDMNDRIEGAVVTLENGLSTLSTKTGYWEFELEPWTYKVTATKTGYYPNFSIRTVKAGKEVWGSIGLTPLPQVVDEPLEISEEAYQKEIFEKGEYTEEYAEEIAERVQPDEINYSDLCLSSDCAEKAASGGGCSISSYSGVHTIFILLLFSLVTIARLVWQRE